PDVQHTILRQHGRPRYREEGGILCYAAGALAGSGPGVPAMPDTPADTARSGAGHALGRVHRASVGVALVPGQGLADQMRRVPPAGTGAAEIIQQLFAVVRMRAAFDDAG